MQAYQTLPILSCRCTRVRAAFTYVRQAQQPAPRYRYKAPREERRYASLSACRLRPSRCRKQFTAST